MDSEEIPVEYHGIVQEAESNKSEWEKTHSLYKAQKVYDEEYGEDDDLGSLESFPQAYQKTNFSMTSSAMFRNQQLTLLDDRFDKILQDYSDSEEDESDDENSQKQFLSQNRIEPILEEFLDETEIIGRKKRVIPKRDHLDTKQEYLQDILARVSLQDENEEQKEIVEVDEKPKLEWDVESVLSTYSNIYNRPKILNDGIKIKLKGRNKMPVVMEDCISEEEEDSEQEDQLKENKGVARPRKESKEEKKARKQAIKEERKDRRAIKKMTKEVFKGEVMKQSKLHQSQRTNVHDLY